MGKNNQGEMNNKNNKYNNTYKKLNLILINGLVASLFIMGRFFLYNGCPAHIYLCIISS